MEIVVGTRGSRLALIQTRWVMEQLKAVYPELQFKTKIINTTGDLNQHLSLDKIGDKGLFVKEIEQQLLNKNIDIAVHSMKDMPGSLPPGLKFATVPKRVDARDVLILKEGYQSLCDLPDGATIGTGSKRRKYQLLRQRPDLCIVPIRGNIETRIEKIATEPLDGIVLAAAGLIRAGLVQRISSYLPIEIMLPAPAQGALAIEIREADTKLAMLIKSIKDEIAEIQVTAERGFLEGIEGSCHIPIGAYSQIVGDQMILSGLYGDEQGEILIKKTITGKVEEARTLGLKLANNVLKEYKAYAR